MTRWTNPVFVDEKFDAKKKFGDRRGIYQFSISRSIAYPKMAGKVIYIGKSSDLGGKVSDHLKKSDSKSLQAYISSRNKIYVSVKRAPAKGRTYLKTMETNALNDHYSKYGMIPICNNKNI